MRMVAAKIDNAHTQHPDRGYATKHRMTVFASSSTDAVAYAGGLIFDRVGAGWDVQIHLTTDSPGDGRALQILGIQKPMQSTPFDGTEWPDLILIGPDVYRQNAQARRIFTAAARRPPTEVAMWGDEWPTNLHPGIGQVEHRLSTAARAFKAHAMGAAGLKPAVIRAEQFHSGQRRFDIAASLLPPA